VLLSEITTFGFSEKKGIRIINRTTELTAREEVTFIENKEGMLVLRMDRAFEEPAEKPGRFLDADGNVTEVLVFNNEGVNGVYRDAEGFTKLEVWGKRSAWVAPRAEKEGRAAPGTHNEDFNAYFIALKDIDYKGMMSIEGRWEDMETQAASALESIKNQLSAIK
jgi:hypothetical protein